MLGSSGEVRARSASCGYDLPGQQIPNLLRRISRLIGGKEIVKTVVLSDNDNDVLDGSGCSDIADWGRRWRRRSATASYQLKGKQQHECALQMEYKVGP